MSDIQAGDVVVCVDASLPPGLIPIGLVQWRAYRIAAVFPGKVSNLPAVTLVSGPDASRVTRDGGFGVERFRKLNDGTDDAELIERIRKCKPARQPEPAL